MNVPTITMEPDQAREKLKAYRRELHHQADETYQAAAAGYQALADGFDLIDINQAIHAGGYFPDSGFPRLAIARADRPVVYCARRQDRWEFDSSSRKTGRPGPSLLVTVTNESENRRWEAKFARVPMVPADVKQQLRAMGRSVVRKNYLILWEVSQWYDRNPLEPPVDPFLLKHCGGSLYAVLAQWDLTELERSVMRQMVGR